MKKTLSKLDKIDWGNFGLQTKTTLGKDGYSSSTEWFASIGKEKENLDKSLEELKEFEEKGKLDEKAINLAMKIVVENYKNLAEKQQNLLLEEQKKVVRLEEEKKVTDTLYSIMEKSRNDLQKEVRQLENINTKLRLKLSNHGIKEEKSDLDDTPWREWEKKNRKW